MAAPGPRNRTACAASAPGAPSPLAAESCCSESSPAVSGPAGSRACTARECRGFRALRRCAAAPPVGGGGGVAGWDRWRPPSPGRPSPARGVWACSRPAGAGLASRALRLTRRERRVCMLRCPHCLNARLDRCPCAWWAVVGGPAPNAGLALASAVQLPSGQCGDQQNANYVAGCREQLCRQQLPCWRAPPPPARRPRTPRSSHPGAQFIHIAAA